MLVAVALLRWYVGHSFALPPPSNPACGLVDLYLCRRLFGGATHLLHLAFRLWLAGTSWLAGQVRRWKIEAVDIVPQT